MVYPTLWRTSSPSMWDEVFSTRRELDRVLDRFFTPGTTTMSAWTPAVDVRESADEIRVRAELPGLTREDIQVNIENNVLTIAGEKKAEVNEQEEGDWHLVERRYGRFERSFTLPRTVDAQGIAATFQDGILTVTLPKAEEAKPRRIEIAVHGGKRI